MRRRGRRRACWFRSISFAQQTASHAQRALGLFDINRFSENQVGADAECFGNASLAFNDGDGERRLIGSGIVGALEQQGGILLTVTVHHDGIEVLGHQLLDGGERFVAGLYSKLQFGQNLRDYASGFLIWAE